MRNINFVSEIGSEFHAVPCDFKNEFSFFNSENFVFSGRTAIETVLKEIPDAKKVLLPSYCCESMIIPFRRAGIDVSFYDVWYEDGLSFDVNIAPDIDVLLWCNYFGFKNEMPDLMSFKNRGGIIIEDITHSFLSTQQSHRQSDFLVASLRKWEPVYCGGYCVSTKGSLNHMPIFEPPDDYITTKQTAMEMKAEYLQDHDDTKKIEFLRLFEKSNAWLAENYSKLAIDLWSKKFLSTVDANKQRKIRRNNASVLYEGLQRKIDFLFSADDMDCPLFVPIILPAERSEIRKTLIQNKIYCPIHWPKPQGCESNLYDLELSLICDQRYTKEDMERIVTVLRKLL